jgi:hypothetical protein
MISAQRRKSRKNPGVRDGWMDARYEVIFEIITEGQIY